MHGAEVGQWEDAAAIGAAWRLDDDLGRGTGGAGDLLRRAAAPAAGRVGQRELEFVAALVGHRCSYRVTGLDRAAEVVRGVGVGLVPAVVLGLAVHAVGVGAVLLDAVAAVSVEADPEAGVLVSPRRAGAGGLDPAGRHAGVGAAVGGVAGPVGARGLVAQPAVCAERRSPGLGDMLVCAAVPDGQRAARVGRGGGGGGGQGGRDG